MSLAVIEQDAAPPSFLRERLRDAILDRDTKSARQAEAASALSRCDEMLAEKEQRLATEFGDLDDVLAQHMAVALKNDSEPDPAVAEQMTAMRAARLRPTRIEHVVDGVKLRAQLTAAAQGASGDDR